MERLWVPPSFRRRSRRGRRTDDVAGPCVPWGRAPRECGQSPLEQGPLPAGAVGAGGAYSTPLSAGNTKLWLRADNGYNFGGMATPIATGTTPPTVTLTGTPSNFVTSFQMTCTVLGVLGVSHVSITINGNLVYAGVSAASIGPYDGITVNIAAGAMALNDVWTSVPVVSSLTSLEGNLYPFVQATVSNMPAWIAPGGSPVAGWPAGINNQASLYFQGSSSQVLSDTTWGSLAQPLTAYVVAQATAAVGGTEILFCDNADDLYFALFSSTIIGCYAASGVPSMQETIVSLSPFALSAVVNGSASRLPANAAAKGSLGASGIVTGLSVGANPGGDFSTALIAEILVYSVAQNNQTAASVTGYLANRYAL